MKITKHIITFLLLIFSTAIFSQIKIGDKIPSIKLKNKFNEEINIIQYKNKYLLVDFWASWCAPCRLGNRKLVKLHNSLNPTKIKIIGISFDTDRKKWNKAIEKDEITFLQLIDPKGFNGKSALSFGVDEIPAKYLFNGKGVLIMINPTNEQIINLIN